MTVSLHKVIFLLNSEPAIYMKFEIQKSSVRCFNTTAVNLVSCNMDHIVAQVSAVALTLAFSTSCGEYFVDFSADKQRGDQ